MHLRYWNEELIKQYSSEKQAILQNKKLIKQEFESIQKTMDVKSKRLIQAAQEKGESACLSALPIKRLGYVVNKQEFRKVNGLSQKNEPRGMEERFFSGEILLFLRGGF